MAVVMLSNSTLLEKKGKSKSIEYFLSKYSRIRRYSFLLSTQCSAKIPYALRSAILYSDHSIRNFRKLVHIKKAVLDVNSVHIAELTSARNAKPLPLKGMYLTLNQRNIPFSPLDSQFKLFLVVCGKIISIVS